MIVGPWVPPVLVPFLLAMVGACLFVRWLLPLLLRLLGKVVDCVVGLVAVALVLPEYWMSVRRRRGALEPLPWAYDYGDAVVALARLVHRVTAFVLGRAAARARTLPAFPVALLAFLVTCLWRAA